MHYIRRGCTSKDNKPSPFFSDYFKNLLLSGDHHDLLINVKEKQLRAHTCVLRIRSPRHRSGVQQRNGGKCRELSHDGELLHYVYTGEVDIASTSSSLGLYYAGDKVDFPRLKEMCVRFLKNSLPTTTVFDVISLSARHDDKELRQEAVVHLLKHLEEVMCTVEWQRFLLANPIGASV